MSYFSHNPEKWDEIEAKAVATFLVSGVNVDVDDELIADVIELRDEQPDVWKLIDQVMPLKFTTDAEESFWSDQADGYLAMGEY